MNIRYAGYFMKSLGISIVFLCSFSGLTSAIRLPQDFEHSQLGMTLEELKKDVPLIETDDQMGYADHFEEEPDVYFFRDEKKARKIEYYFFKNRLYKIFVIYDPHTYKADFYDKLVTEMEGKYGSPADRYKKNVFGISVEHTVWNNKKTILDIRNGAGFIYKVIIDKASLQQKEEYLNRKKAI
ncbi:MAG: hypothetical protein ACE5EA_03255 [Nitrospirota bacterium]